MSQEVLLHLFEPFYSTKIGQGGSGLGMSIVESIVRKTLGGSLHVQSAPGSGTTIEVQLPKSAPEYTI
jgi:signal transduction histidine kinase